MQKAFLIDRYKSADETSGLGFRRYHHQGHPGRRHHRCLDQAFESQERYRAWIQECPPVIARCFQPLHRSGLTLAGLGRPHLEGFELELERALLCLLREYECCVWNTIKQHSLVERFKDGFYIGEPRTARSGQFAITGVAHSHA